jgi:hypothetical protein
LFIQNTTKTKNASIMKQILQLNWFKVNAIAAGLMLAAIGIHAQPVLRNPAYAFLPPALEGIRPGNSITDAPQQFSTNLKKLTATDTTTVDGNITVLGNNFSNGPDAADVLKINNPGENLALVRNNTLLVIESRKPVVSRDTIEYSMYNMQTGNYQLEFVGINMSIPGLTAVLIDRFLNTTTPIALNLSATIYNFQITANAASAAANRFIVILVQAAPAPLPVNFVSIQASRTNIGNTVKWTVAGELNIRSYNLERSTDGRNFSTVANIAATTGSSLQKTYQLSDNILNSSTLFYRLRANELDGTYKYSAIVKVQASGKNPSVNIYPNPVKNGLVNLALENEVAGRYHAVITTTTGAQVTQISWQHAGGSALQSIALPQNLSKGYYQLRLMKADNTSTTLKFLVD